MSGGVDSSVAAARLVRAGYEVVGVTLHLWDYPDDGSVESRCCAPEDVHDAGRVAAALGIPHYSFDRRELFKREVVDPFVAAYLDGETPSPCVLCNRGVKAAELIHLADRLGAQRVATGHYARLVREGGKQRLYRAVDRSKDQSYFLHMLGAERLGRLMFPLGDATKGQVRGEARDLDLPGATKGESQELCFVPSGRYDAFITERAGAKVRPGPIVDGQGQTVGSHDGLHAFTIGQRKNLGVALGRRAYVTEIEPETATVRLGDADQLMRDKVLLGDVAIDDDVALPLRCAVSVRYRGKAFDAVVADAGEGRVEVRFIDPVRAAVPGQFAVFYRGDRVLGGGVITQASASHASTVDAQPEVRC